MRDREIKLLFEKANEQVLVNETRKQDAYMKLANEMDKQRVTLMSRKNILLSYFLYMDKVYFAAYAVLLCLGFVLISVLDNMGIERDGMIAVCAIFAGVLSVITIGIINRLLFEGMAELGASCYWSTKQCVATHLVLAGGINLVILLVMSFYLGFHWQISVMHVVLYILTPFLTSSSVALGILSTETGRKTHYSLVVCIIFLSVVYAVICSIPIVFMVASLWIWGIAFMVDIFWLAIQLIRLFKQMEKGELLCMN